MQVTVSFGYWIRRQRKALDLTQQALADRVGCSLAAIKKIESDERRPSRQIAERMADVLGVPANQREIFLEVARGLRSADQLSIPYESKISSERSPWPTGTVTFLYTDIEGSTKLWEGHPQAMASAHARHDQILREAIESNKGYVFHVVGDAFCAAFPSAEAAVRAAAKAQIDLQAEGWDESPIRVRMGIHTGKADVQPDGQYSGYVTLSHAQRVMSIAAGGQILLSFTAHELAEGELPEGMALRDAGPIRLKDWDRTQHLYQLTIPGLPTDFPPLKDLESVPHNLPTQLTSFVGRTHELDETRQLLSHTRLLTLTGSGGTGKTRLSLQLAMEVKETGAFPDGVWLVGLAPVTDPSLVMQAVVSTLGIREQPGRTILDALLDYLRAKSILLILDNCEHLIDACGQLADTILRVAPNLKILASSREILGIAGETAYRVPSLSLPDLNEVRGQEIMTSESVRLFVERAAAAQSGFNLTDQNAPDIAEICRRLDGIPLALELAAARVHIFSPREIAARLEDRFKLLAGGNRSAMPRHQTLRALIDWSYDLLSADEQLLFPQLSVFNGGWTFGAAEAIYPDLDLLSLLPQLVNKSLVMVDQTPNDTRYHLPETIRQYARDKLFEAGEAKQARNRHLDFFLKLAEEAERHYNTFQEMDWMSKLEADDDNLRTALDWAMEQDVSLALRLATALALFWNRHGYETEGHRLLSNSLARLQALPKVEGELAYQRTALQSKALNVIGVLSFGRGDFIGSRKYFEESIRLARQIGEKYRLAEALSFMAVGKAFLEDREDSYPLAEEGLALAREMDDKFLLGMALSNMAATIAMTRGDTTAMRSIAEEGLRLLREVGANWAIAMSTLGMAFFATRKGDYAQARLLFENGMALFRELRDEHRVTMARSELAHLDRRQGHIAKAKALYRETLLDWQRLGHRAAIAHELECMAMLALAQEEEQRAARLFGAAEILRETINIPMTPFERAEYDREVESLRLNMDEAAFTKAWSEGRALTVEGAIGLALETENGEMHFPVDNSQSNPT